MQNDHGGRGILLGGVPGVPPAEVVILGAGVVGSTAADSFARIGAHVTVLDIDLRRLQEVQDRSPQSVVTLLSTPYNVERSCQYADVLVGAVLVPGSRSPIVVSREIVSLMKPRSLIIDMSIDQGGCIETSRPTNHGSPTYEEEGVIHYCVPNMSGVLGRTATYALFLGAYPYLEAIAKDGVEGAIRERPGLECGLATSNGKYIHLNRLGDVPESAK
jgi:alanine dehydrogenase